MQETRPSRFIQFLCGHTEVVHDARVDVIDTAIRLRHAYQGWYRVDGQAKLAFALPRGFFGLFPLFDVPSDAVPANHIALFIPERPRPGVEPAIHAVGSTHSQLPFEGPVAAESFSDSLHPDCNIVRV